jgi:DNA polymerase kappa
VKRYGSGFDSNIMDRTFRSLSSRTDLYFKLKDISHKLAKDLESKNLCGKTVGLKIKLTSFEVRTRAKTLPSNIYKQEDLEKYASQVCYGMRGWYDAFYVHTTHHCPQLLEKELPVSLRLMGIRLSSLSSRDEQEQKGVKRVGVFSTS